MLIYIFLPLLSRYSLSRYSFSCFFGFCLSVCLFCLIRILRKCGGSELPGRECLYRLVGGKET